MKVDIEHVLYWMDAIRESSDKDRTLEAFWKGQIHSKVWLVNALVEAKLIRKPAAIDIHGGWVGVLASLLFQSHLPITRIRTIDIDPTCQSTAYTINKIEEIEGRFEAVTSDMCCVDVTADVIINTSVEHLSEEKYDTWLANLPRSSIIVLQSNNYEIPEHSRIATSLKEFITQSRLAPIHAGKISLPKYDRYMIIGTKNV